MDESHKKPLTLGFLGFGTVLGKGAFALIKEMGEDSPYRVKAIFVRNTKAYQMMYPELPQSVFVDQAKTILEDSEIDVVIEGLGGLIPAHEYVEAALRSGKHVISANKDMLATYMDQLFEMALRKNVHLRFEAGVCGGMHLLAPIMELAKHHKITKIYGIVNGTTNYILTQMSAKHLPFQKALEQAQEAGFAEANPDTDVKGLDSAYKLCLLAVLGMGRRLRVASIAIAGIDTITAHDLDEAIADGMKFKLIAECHLTEEGEMIASVAPRLIPKSHPCFSVDNEMNLVMVETAEGKVFQFGPDPGAGALPTGASIVRDLELITKEGMERHLVEEQ
jgi:homoserine dehydrogenase